MKRKTNLQHSPDGNGILFCLFLTDKKDTVDSRLEPSAEELTVCS
ncbi:hypothetical protein ACFO4P_10095 [Epilithonimonas pallida]|nr:hypothetical protein [Epilithonimonas pallida]